jgi:hypothetical protein
MLKPLAGLPHGVIGFEANGELQASDYTDVLLPAVDRALASGDDVRIVLVFEQSTASPASRCGKTSRWASSTSCVGNASLSSPTSTG